MQKVIDCTPTRRGLTFVRAKVSKTRSRGTDSPLTNPFLSPCCAGYGFIFRLPPKNKSVLRTDGLNKVSVTHLPPPNLPRFGGGERPPFPCKPPAPLTITMGQRLTVFASHFSLRVQGFPFCCCQPIRATFPHQERGGFPRTDHHQPALSPFSHPKAGEGSPSTDHHQPALSPFSHPKAGEGSPPAPSMSGE